MVLEKIRTSMPRPLRDRCARNTDRALRLPRRIVSHEHPETIRFESQVSLSTFPRYAFLQLDGVALHLVVEGRALNAEKFGSFFLVAAALCECLENGGSLDVVESLYAAARQCPELGLLQRNGQLYFCGELFYVDQTLSCQNDGVFNCVLQFANISWPCVIKQLL